MTTMTWDEMRAMPITEEEIGRSRAAGACEEAIEWAEAKPRAWGDAPPAWIGWYGRYAATPDQLDACIAGTDAWGRGMLGMTRRDLTPAQRAAVQLRRPALREDAFGATKKQTTDVPELPEAI